jgi:Berberine and berberine like
MKGALATTGTLGWTTASGQRAMRDTRQIDSTALRKFRAQLSGSLLLPTDPGYETARRIYFWNPDTERQPVLVARCAHGDDVRYAVEFARRHGLDIAVRGGGHSPMGWGITHYMHGEVCRVAPDATAFPLRQSGGFLVRINLDWSDSAAAPRLMGWADDTRRLLQASSGERIYAGYQSHAGKGSAEAVFGSNLPRLAAIKNKYDPNNVFRRNSNVEPRPLGG